MAVEMTGFGKTSALKAVTHDRKRLSCQYFDAAVDNAGCYILTLVNVPVEDGHIFKTGRGAA